MTPTQRKNLLKLAAYLESLPANYEHFDMSDYADHTGYCDLESPDRLAAKKPAVFFNNCGTVACAAGHGPAAGVRLRANEFYVSGPPRWEDYCARAFTGESDDLWEFLFGGHWGSFDNHHHGAAARIRYVLDTGRTPNVNASAVKLYAPYRKGSRSAKRRAIEAAA